MPDNYSATPGIGLLFAAKDEGGLLYPILLPYAKPADRVRGVSVDITGLVAVQVVASPGVGYKLNITHILVTNSDATVGTMVNLTDGIAGGVLLSGYAAEAGGGFSVSLPVPLTLTLATALYAICETNHANVRVSASGFRSV